ncbi:MAG TPA: GNAT family N-acetyltransferase [Candidatus Flavonifractor merdigallinarum]|uniref:GNAT family N-acetyltransferase n=1 Tax=Candidatus Flavonifractor merdigallinarum TaxID=2838589 RepID=A0A9D1YAN2_9FIRM|nr:GNAT family N-acetyltransferase [Candidatus Flavonifractor merdigallinarum]
MAELRLVEATTPEHFRTMSAIHARGWRKTYPGYVPDDYMRDVITDDHWVSIFAANRAAGHWQGLMLYRGDTPVACCTYGAGRNQGPEGPRYAGWGELWTFYTDPAHTGQGYGGLLMEAALDRLRAAGYTQCFVLVLRENEGARRFYARHGFHWDGTQVEIPFPPQVCIDLRYTQAL